MALDRKNLRLPWERHAPRRLPSRRHLGWGRDYYPFTQLAEAALLWSRHPFCGGLERKVPRTPAPYSPPRDGDERVRSFLFFSSSRAHKTNREEQVSPQPRCLCPEPPAVPAPTSFRIAPSCFSLRVVVSNVWGLKKKSGLVAQKTHWTALGEFLFYWMILTLPNWGLFVCCVESVIEISPSKTESWMKMFIGGRKGVL